MSAADRFYFVLLLYTLQVACEAIPLTLEINRHQPGTNQNVIHKFGIDDSAVPNANPQALASTGSARPMPVYSENVLQHALISGYDKHEESKKSASNKNQLGDNDAEAYEYYFDCSVPLMPPDIEEYRRQTRDMTSQHQLSPGLIGSVTGCINGIVMSAMAIGFNIANTILPSSFRHE